MVTKLRPLQKPLLGKGNSKLGNALTFSLPAIQTCPGATELCSSLCYAARGFYTYKNVKDKLAWAYRTSKSDNFQERVIAELAKVKPDTIFRIHPSGDFYSIIYASKWLQIIRNSPHITFWVYTRSWRRPGFLDIFKEFAKQPNVALWFSCDKETGKPPSVPKNVRLAYMMVGDDDIPKYKVDLFFRDYQLRSGIVKHINGTLVCPPENGASHNVHCDKCRICLTLPKDDPRRRTRDRFPTDKPWTNTNTMPQRIPLPLVN